MKDGPLGEILNDRVEVQSSQNNPPFDPSFNYAQEVKRRDSAVEKWKNLGASERANFGNSLERFFASEGVLDLKSDSAVKGKNLFLLRAEIRTQTGNESPLKLLNIEELHLSTSLLELLENVENVEHIRELYRLRKRTVGNTRNSGITAIEAARLKNCLRQGRELYESGRSGSLMVKPLSFFYSLTAYAYAVVVLNNPIRFSLETMPGSHGVNYLSDELLTQFGGNIKQGTFSELFSSFPTGLIRDRQVDIIQDNETSILSLYQNKFTVACGTLLSMIPEVREYYRLVSGKASRTFPLELTATKGSRSSKWEFQIGDGETRPSLGDVENSFPEFQRTERHGKYVVTVPFEEAHKIRATVYSDLRGKFWYVENPFFPLIVPELCVHFLLTNVLSNIMRYSPDRWGDILLNEVRSDVSLITRKYLSAFEIKLPILLLRAISKFYPLVSAEN